MQPPSCGNTGIPVFSKLPQILNSFRSSHPRVPVKVTASTPNQLIDMMERNQLDLIYILDRPRYNDNWNKVMEVREPIVFVASPSCGLEGNRVISLEEIMDEPFFLTEKNENYRRELDCFPGITGNGPHSLWKSAIRNSS